MGKKRHSQDRLFITATEWAKEYGGKKKIEAVSIMALPFDHCALSLSPFENPVCTDEGIVFDKENLLTYLKNREENPITGAPMSVSDIIHLHMHKNNEGEWHCPVTYKIFNNTSHIVAVKTSGNVYSFEAVNELNLKGKNFSDLLTGESFKRSDIVTLQDPQNEGITARRDVNRYVQLKIARDELINARKSDVMIRANPTSEVVMREIARKREEEAKEAAGGVKKRTLADIIADSKKQEYVDDVAEILALRPLSSDVIPGKLNTTGRAGNALTSTVAACDTSADVRLATADEIREAKWRKLRSIGKKGYVQLQTNFGNLNLELHCDWAQRTCWNFITLCERGYYEGTTFHRLVTNFMIQAGDPTGTGSGGASAWGSPFRDEFDSRLLHSERGVVSMANSGPNTNSSQFFITFKEAKHLDNRHAIFGKLVGGANVLAKLEAIGSDSKEKPLEEIKILKSIVFNSPITEAEQSLMEDVKKNMKQRIHAAARSALPSSSSSSAIAISSSSTSAVIGSQNKPKTSLSAVADTVQAAKAPPAVSADASSKDPNVAVKRFLSSATVSSSYIAAVASSAHQQQEIQAKKKPKTVGEFGNFSGW